MVSAGDIVSLNKKLPLIGSQFSWEDLPAGTHARVTDVGDDLAIIEVLDSDYEGLKVGCDIGRLDKVDDKD